MAFIGDSGCNGQTQANLILVHWFCSWFPFSANGKVIITVTPPKILILFFALLTPVL